MQVFMFTVSLFQEIGNGTLLPIFGHNDVILGVKYLKYVKTGSVFEFFTLNLLQMQSFIISALFVEKIGK